MPDRRSSLLRDPAAALFFLTIINDTQYTQTTVYYKVISFMILGGDDSSPSKIS